jgi:hypothetical protein
VRIGASDRLRWASPGELEALGLPSAMRALLAGFGPRAGLEGLRNRRVGLGKRTDFQ